MIAVLNFCDFNPDSFIEKTNNIKENIKLLKRTNSYNKQCLIDFYNTLEDLNAFDVVTIGSCLISNSCHYWLFIEGPEAVINVLSEQLLVTVTKCQAEANGDDR